jgi:hypothetical protein
LDLLTVDEKELLTRAVGLMEELLETLDVMRDKEAVADLRAALKEVESGKARPFEELARELGLEAEI